MSLGHERIDMAVFGPLPGYARASLRLRHLDAGRSASQAAAALQQAGRAASGLAQDDPRLARWRAAYEVVGLPDDTLPPPAALLAWAASPGGVPSQGPLFDLVHASALRHLMPAAVYDLAELQTDLWLRPSRGVESMELAGDEAPLCATINELILVDGLDRVHARAWHGTQSALSLPSPRTRDALVHLDVLAEDDLPETARAVAEARVVQLARLCEAFLGAEATWHVLSIDRPQVLWTA